MTDPAPFTVEHFELWVDRNELTLEEGQPWAPLIQDFQRNIIHDIFTVPAGGEVWVIIPEGNAKTTLLATLGLYHLDHTHSPWVPIGASSREQAEIMHAQAGGFVERSEKLRYDKEKNPLGMRVYDGYRKIVTYRQKGRGMRVYAADANTGDGVIPTLALVDELHRHEDLSLYRLWKGKLRKRGGRIVTISTAGEPGTEFEQQRDKIRNEAPERKRDGMHVRAVGRGGRLIFHEWKVSPDSAYADMEKVAQANPLMTITSETLAEDFDSLTVDIGDWKRLKCNVAARSSEAAISDAEWDALELDDGIPEGVPVDVGFDVGWKWDTTAIVPVWTKAYDQRIVDQVRILEPPRDGTQLSVDEIKIAFEEIHARNPIRTVVMDTSRAEDVSQWIEDEMGVEEVVDRAQTTTFAVEDFDKMIEAVRNKLIWHCGHPVLRAHVLNAISRALPGGDRRFDRPSTSRSAKKQDVRVIDALTALSMVNWLIATEGGESDVFSFDEDELADDDDIAA